MTTSSLHPFLVRVAVVVMCAGAATHDAHAQGGSVADETGAQRNRSYLALLPFESIDTSSGNVMLSFTDLVLPGNGGRALQFNRMLSNRSSNDPSLQRWHFSISDVPMRVQNLSTADNPPSSDTILFNQTYAPIFEMPDGTRQKSVFLQAPSVQTRWFITPSFWKFDRTMRILYMPDGTRAAYDTAGRLVTIFDVFDNTTTLAYGTGLLTVRQLLGPGQERVIQFVMDDSALMPIAMTYAGKTWEYEYLPGGAPGQLTRVTPPFGTGWEYAYEGGGKIQQVTTPHGGRITYEYDWKPFNRESGGTHPVHTLKTRRTHGADEDGTWQFAYSEDNSGITTVTLPSGSTVTHLYSIWTDDTTKLLSSNWVLISRIVRAVAGGPVIEEETLTYESLKAARPEKDWYTNELSRRVIVRNGLSYTTEYVYDLQDDSTLINYHRPIRVEESGDSGATTRTRHVTQRHFASPSPGPGIPYILGLPASEVIDVNGQTFSRAWSYDNWGFLLTDTRYGITTTFTRDEFGNVKTVAKPGRTPTKLSYEWGQVSQTESPKVTTTRAFYPDGTVMSETTAGRTTTYNYDDLFRVTSVQPPGGTQRIQTIYHGDGAGVTTRRGNSQAVTTLDGFGRPIRTVNSANVETRTAYDAEGRRRVVSLPFKGVEKSTTFSYDGLGRVACEANPGAQCFPSPSGAIRRRVYAGNTVHVFDEENRETVLTYAAFGDPDDARLTGVLDADSKQWTYTYNAVGSLTGVMGPNGPNGNGNRTWTYDSRNLLTRETHPESGAVDYTYDGAGVLKRKVDNRGTVFLYGHDDNDRLTSVDAGGRVTTIAYEPGSDNSTSTSVVARGSTDFSYDPATGRLTSRRDTIEGSQPFVTSFEYDGNDNLQKITYPSGRRLRYDYNDENQIVRVINDKTEYIYASDFRYHPSGGVESYRSGNDLLTTIQYDPNRYWVSSIGVGPLQLTYGRDNVGNVRSIQDQHMGNQAFEYDALDRLRTATGPYAMTLDYDPHGNRKDAGGATYSYIGNTFRLGTMNGTTMEYDANGNLRSGPGVTLDYTPDNLLKESTAGGKIASFSYDADQWRTYKFVQDTVQGTAVKSFFVRGPGGQLLSEWTNTGPTTAEVKDYIYAGSRLIAVQKTLTLPPK
jgi:YD repeat-containing protein